MQHSKSGLDGFDGYAGGSVSSLGGPAAVSTPLLCLELGEKWRLGGLAKAGTRKLGTATAPAIALLVGRNACVRAVRRHVWVALMESCGMGGGVVGGAAANADFRRCLRRRQRATVGYFLHS